MVQFKCINYSDKLQIKDMKKSFYYRQSIHKVQLTKLPRFHGTGNYSCFHVNVSPVSETTRVSTSASLKKQELLKF